MSKENWTGSAQPGEVHGVAFPDDIAIECLRQMACSLAWEKTSGTYSQALRMHWCQFVIQVGDWAGNSSQ